MDEEIQIKINELKQKMNSLQMDLDDLRGEVKNHKHDSDGIYSHNC